MALDRRRLVEIWREAIALGWPVSVQQGLNTLMRTVDVLVAGLFSPVAVAAIGLADLYARIPLRVGMGLGSGAIALSSQETGRGSTELRDEAITQSMVMGALVGIPLFLVGLGFSRGLIALLGADSEVARVGGHYLTIIFAASPFRILAFVGARALQGVGDTRTPMVVNGGATLLNIVLTVALGLGAGPIPRLGIVGVGLATAISRTVEALLVTAAIVSERTTPGFARPQHLTLAKQLFEVSVPDIAGGLGSELARFPFNGIVLLFGTEANAAYHIGNRVYQQVAAPFFRAVRTVASIVVGQEVGAGRVEAARESVTALIALSLLVLGAIATALFVGAGAIGVLFTDDATTIGFVGQFNRTFAVALVFFAVFFPLAGALRGAGDTRTPFWASMIGAYVFLLGGAYLLAVALEFGIVGVYAAIVLAWVSRTVVVGVGWRAGTWADLASRMIDEREQVEDG